MSFFSLLRRPMPLMKSMYNIHGIKSTYALVRFGMLLCAILQVVYTALKRILLCNECYHWISPSFQFAAEYTLKKEQTAFVYVNVSMHSNSPHTFYTILFPAVFTMHHLLYCLFRMNVVYFYYFYYKKEKNAT